MLSVPPSQPCHHPVPPALAACLVTRITPRTGFGLVNNAQLCMGESHISVSHCFTSLSVLHWPYSFSARPRAGTQCSASPPGPTSHAPSHHGILAPWLNLWLLVGGGYGLGDHRERRVAKAVPRFPSGLLGANECTEPQPGVGVGTASMFSFCSVCFLFRSTAQFWFGLLRADGLWQVRISGATRLCLLQGCGLSS